MIVYPGFLSLKVLCNISVTQTYYEIKDLKADVPTGLKNMLSTKNISKTWASKQKETSEI